MNITDILDIAGKPIVIFLLGYLFIHLMKKHSVGTTTPVDFLIAVVLGNILAQPIVSDQLSQTIFYGTMFVLMQIILSKLILWRPARRKLAFKPTVLINKGNIDEIALSRERVTISHLLAELRIKGYPNIADVEYAILEETGGISVIPKADKRPLQPSDLQLQTTYQGYPNNLIVDGEIIDTTLSTLGKDHAWLISLLSTYGITQDSFNKISVASLDGSGKLHVDYFGRGNRT